MATEVSRRASSACAVAVAGAGGERRRQRNTDHHIPQDAVDHVVAAAFIIEIKRDAGALQADGHRAQRAADQNKAEPSG